MADERVQPHDNDASQSEQFWEQRYQERGQMWSGRANPILVQVVEPLTPGKALDLGSGEGGDAIWLAQHGWQVTAVDVSQTALDRAKAQASKLGLADRINFQQHDLGRTFPAGAFNLISAQYLQSPIDFPRTQALQKAARAVMVNGLLLIVTHGSHMPWGWHCHEDIRIPTPAEELAALKLDLDQWHIERLDTPERLATGPNGQTATVKDNVIELRRLK